MIFAYRLAKEADQPVINALLAQVGLAVNGLPQPTRQWFFYNDELQGTIALEAYSGWGLLRSVVVSAGQRGQGMGSVMVSLAEQEAGRLGIKHLWLLTETAAGFFAKLGYQVQPRDTAPPGLQAHPQFSQLCPQSAVLMVKALG